VIHLIGGGWDPAYAGALYGAFLQEAAAVAEPVAGEIVGVIEPAPVVEGEEEAEEEDEGTSAKKKKKGKLKAVIELDPETGLTVARRKRKPGRTKDWVEDGSGESV